MADDFEFEKEQQVRKSSILAGLMVAVAIAVLTASLQAARPAEQADQGQEKKATTQKASLRTGILRRMADGHPDIRGTWAKVGGGLNEANPVPTDLKPFVLAEPKGFGQQGLFAGPDGELVTIKPRYEPEAKLPNGIVDPADRVLPYRPEALAARQDWAKKMCCPAYSLEHLELSARCTPPAPWTSNGRVDVIQRPREIVLMFEANHSTRVIYTDGRAHQGSNIRTFGGDSTGKWEGNTLTVDTTNLIGL